MGTDQNVEISEKLTWSRSALYADLGGTLLGQPILPDNLDIRIREGKRWLLSKRKELANAVCTDPTVKSYLDDERKLDKALLVSAVIDSILAIVGKPSVVSASVLLVSEGLDQLCAVD